MEFSNPDSRYRVFPSSQAGLAQPKNMDSSLMAFAFGESLVRFLIEKNGMSWIPPNNVHTLVSVDFMNSDLIKHVGTAVWNLILRKQSDVLACKEELEEIGCTGKDEFSQYALSAARIYFIAGYSSVCLLSYCAMVGGVSMMFYGADKVELPNCAAGVIGIVVTGHIVMNTFLKKGGYVDLMETSKLFNGGIEYQKSLKCDEQLDSDHQAN